MKLVKIKAEGVKCGDTAFHFKENTFYIYINPQKVQQVCTTFGDTSLTQIILDNGDVVVSFEKLREVVNKLSDDGDNSNNCTY